MWYNTTTRQKNNNILEDLIMGTIRHALDIATRAHKNQIDKAGKSYIEHPKAVANLLDSTKAKIVALLHDVVEDTPWTLDDLRREGFDLEIIAAVDAITKRPGEANKDYLERVKVNKLATEVKLKDLEHNSSPDRMAQLEREIQANLKKKYDFAREFLLV